MSFASGIVHHNIPDKATLYASYMPFIRNGGLFLPGQTKLRMGQEVFLVLSMMNDPERARVAAKVVWVTPSGAQANRPAGVGVQFLEADKGQTKARIENYLAGMQNSDNPTYTL
ncbi:MAG: pilus assembly protein PilZ [Halothiobacillaceae bacterium]|nr:MAG: pilus assembly protein PilZ [Halothiobacillaceae bacterium]